MSLPKPFMLAVLLCLVGCASTASDSQAAEFMVTKPQGEALQKVVKRVYAAITKIGRPTSVSDIEEMIAQRDSKFLGLLNAQQREFYLSVYRGELSRRVRDSLRTPGSAPVGSGRIPARMGPQTFENR